MQRLFFYLVAAALVFHSGCISELLGTDMPLSLIAPPGNPIDTTGKFRIEGAYRVVEGNGTFGDTLVAIYVRDHLCFFSGREVIFSECVGRVSGDTANFSGYYRFVRSSITGNLSLSILPAEGGTSLKNQTLVSQIIIRGTFKGSQSETEQSIVLSRARAFTSTGKRFEILGNCAGGRNSERLGRSENSIEMGKFSEYLGCTGVEIDHHASE